MPGRSGQCPFEESDETTLVVDGQPVVRDGIKELLQRAFPSVAIKDSAGEDGLLEEVCGYPWAFVVLDINLPGQNGLDIIKKTKVRRPEIPIIVFSLYSERQYAARALRAGAVAYLFERTPPRRFDRDGEDDARRGSGQEAAGSDGL